jgi:hypothetical protein
MLAGEVLLSEKNHLDNAKYIVYFGHSSFFLIFSLVQSRNLRIFWAFESSSKIKDAIPYREKATALCKSRIQNLKKAKEALFADKGANASAAEVGSVKSCPDKRIKYLTPSLTILGKQVHKLDLIPATYLIFP